MNTTQITCRRCKGSGIVQSPVMYCGIPGGCFSCATTGKVYTDKFAREYANVKGDFYGFSWTAPYGKLVKCISRCVESDIMRTRGMTFTKLTEEQAETFFRKYGSRVEFDIKVAA